MDKGINGPNMNRRREELDKGQVRLIREKKQQGIHRGKRQDGRKSQNSPGANGKLLF